MEAKKQAQEAAKQIRDAAKQQDQASLAAIRYLQLSYEAAKESLVSATGDDMYRQQGVAQHLAKMIKELTIIPPTEKRTGDQ